MLSRLQKGDLVVVISGKDKGKQGKVARVLVEDAKVVVEGLNLIKRHTRPTAKNPQGGIIEREAALHGHGVNRPQGFFRLCPAWLVQHAGGNQHQIQRAARTDPSGQRSNAGLVGKVEAQIGIIRPACTGDHLGIGGVGAQTRHQRRADAPASPQNHRSLAGHPARNPSHAAMARALAATWPMIGGG